MKSKITLLMLVLGLGFSQLFAQTASVQVIHNSADAAAAEVDVYINDAKALDNFAFRTATPFIDLPAGVPVKIDIAPATSASSAESVYSMTTTLSAGETYILVANGIVSASGYSPAPAFAIDVFAAGREAASSVSNTDVLVIHGSTDAPTVDVFEQSAGQLIDDIDYKEFAGYLELPNADYYLQVRTSDGATVVAAYDAPLATLGLDGAAITVVASGFLAPANNSDGPAFGLFVALASGGDLVALPASTARVQVIHNSADAAAAEVDVYLNGGMLIDNFAFRTATPFIDAPAGVEISIDVAPGNSSSAAESIYNMKASLMAGETYILVANGIVSASGYSPAPAFAIDVFAAGREAASSVSNTDVLVIHGSTDAPMVDIYEQTAGMLIDNLEYREFAGYLELPTNDYIIEVRDESGENVVVAFEAPLATLGLDGAAITVVASGFLAPANNSDGPAFGLFVALASGGDLVALGIPTFVREIASSSIKIKAYPNPATDFLNLSFDLDNSSDVSIEFYNVLGSRVYQQSLGYMWAGFNEARVDVTNLPSGIYVATLKNGNNQSTVRVKITR